MKKIKAKKSQKAKKKVNNSDKDIIRQKSERIKILAKMNNDSLSEIQELKRDLDGARHVIARLVDDTIYRGRKHGPNFNIIKINDLGFPVRPFNGIS
jgi:hypothetical protein